MKHEWQQPIRPLEVSPNTSDMWVLVLFIRPRNEGGWEVISRAGVIWTNETALIRNAER